MIKFLPAVAIGYLALAIAGLLWTHFESGFFQFLAGFAIAILFVTAISD